MDKSDAIAVIDLAETCTTFEDATNYRAAGVCYNNIANFQYKNEAYSLASENYSTAILLADLCLNLGDRKLRKDYEKQFYTRINK
jgi:hypothetical protein